MPDCPKCGYEAHGDDDTHLCRGDGRMSDERLADPHTIECLERLVQAMDDEGKRMGIADMQGRRIDVQLGDVEVAVRWATHLERSLQAERAAYRISQRQVEVLERIADYTDGDEPMWIESFMNEWNGYDHVCRFCGEKQRSCRNVALEDERHTGDCPRGDLIRFRVSRTEAEREETP